MQRIYEVRYEHLSAQQSSHAKRLAESVAEFARNLAGQSSELIEFVSIQDLEGHSFAVFQRVSDGLIIGCLYTVSKLDVTEEDWKKLWHEGT